MQCIKCGSEDLVDVGTDVFTCDDCGGKVEITYLVCRNCLSSIRLKNGEIYDSISFGPDEFALFGEHSVSMSDLIDVCLRCNQPVIKEGDMYTCPNCGFSWEVVN